jgi:hypothetical protein
LEVALVDERARGRARGLNVSVCTGFGFLGSGRRPSGILTENK